jgi:hypothetical protein
MDSSIRDQVLFQLDFIDGLNIHYCFLHRRHYIS